MAMRNKQIFCSFCGRGSREVMVFPGPNEANICAECVKHINSAITEAEIAVNEGKDKKHAKIAGLNKFLRIYYARVMAIYR